MFKIPAALGVPTTWKGIAYDRNDESLIPLNDSKRNIILSTLNIDWSRQIIEELTVDDLDKDAVLKAREQFKKKNENKSIANDIDKMDDLTFLNKAKVFMGDTGSLYLGGLISCMAIYLKMPLILVIIALVPVCETLSVIIQVAYYKRTKKRIFKMTPIHHHFELSGWKENKVVIVFSLVTLILCIVGLRII